MHIWDDKQSSTTMHHKVPSKKMDYSHCPLKKRPVHFVKNIKEELDFDNTDDYAEPENLSTKPQDLSVKCKSTVAVPMAVPLVVKKETPYQHYHQNYVVPPLSPPPPYHYQHQPYQPTALKQGPLEPLCLNIASDHPAAMQQTSVTSMVSAPVYHHHHHHQQNRYTAPRPVPAQYPGTGYLAGYMYHPGGLQMVDRTYHPTVAYPATMVAPGGAVAGAAIRDSSLSPPGSSGSAFKPLHASPPSATATLTSCSPPMMTWYGRSVGAGDGWSPSTIDMIEMSPPLTSSSSLSAVSPPILPPPAYQHCSGESNGSSAAAALSGANSCKSIEPTTTIAAAAVAAVATTATATAVNNHRYKCTTCSKTYLTMSGLTKHHQYHCSDDEYGGNAAASNVATAAKTFLCKYCDKAYNTLGALKMHIRTHTLPCICKLCGKAFSRPWLLQGHIRTHTGEKPFSCQHCNRAFADRSNLRAHLQTHSDVKKYSCPTCSKTFSRMSLLTKHCDTGCPRLVAQQSI